jgi:hypothetical protein
MTTPEAIRTKILALVKGLKSSITAITFILSILHPSGRFPASNPASAYYESFA